MKPIYAWMVITEDKKVGTFQTVFCPEVFAYPCFENKEEAERLAHLLRRKGYTDFPKIVPVVIGRDRKRKASTLPLYDIRELLDD